jgi:hypothetical protein
MLFVPDLGLSSTPRSADASGNSFRGALEHIPVKLQEALNVELLAELRFYTLAALFAKLPR